MTGVEAWTAARPCAVKAQLLPGMHCGLIVKPAAANFVNRAEARPSDRLTAALNSLRLGLARVASALSNAALVSARRANDDARPPLDGCGAA